MSKVLIIGGSGVISSHTHAALVAQGADLAIFRRKVTPDTGTRIFVGDRHDDDALRTALDSFRPEVVIDFVCFNRIEASALVAVLPTSVAQVVFVSTVDVYGLPLTKLPMVESSAWSPTSSPYATEKLATELALKDQLMARGVALTIVRPTFSAGRGFVISIFDRSARPLIARLRQGLPVPIPASPPDGSLHGWIHASDAADTGRMVALTAGSPLAMNRDYTVGSPNTPMTHLNYVSRIAKAVGVEPKVVMIPRDFLDNHPSVPADCLFREQTRFDLWHSMDRFLGDFPDFRPAKDIDSCLRSYVEAMDQSKFQPGKPDLEGQIIDAWRSAQA